MTCSMGDLVRYVGPGAIPDPACPWTVQDVDGSEVLIRLGTSDLTEVVSASDTVPFEWPLSRETDRDRWLEYQAERRFDRRH